MNKQNEQEKALSMVAIPILFIGAIWLFTGSLIVGIVWTAMLIIYFAPTIIAQKNKKENIQIIALINFFLGGTIIGWVIAMAMAAAKEEGEKEKEEKQEDKEEEQQKSDEQTTT